ncbi:MAG: helix-turn-helix domain-containing protein [Lachnospiraceae bacterium]|nr:helix-turn-helix domain-containing protein [Lachnospiraceae bacterium]
MKNKHYKFGNAMKNLRESKGLTQEQLAAKIEKSTSAVGQFERGINRPNFATLEKIINVLDADANLLFEREEKSYPKEALMIAYMLSSMSSEEKDIIGNMLSELARIMKYD